MTDKITCSIGEKEYLNRDELCAWLGVSGHTVDKLREKGLKYIRIGSNSTSRILFKKQHVRECLDEFVV